MRTRIQVTLETRSGHSTVCRPLSVAVLIIALTGCATKVHDIPSDHTLGDQPESVVFGRLVFPEPTISGMSRDNPVSRFFEGLTHLRLAIENETTGESYEIVCDESGAHARFYVSLSPGEYSLKKMTMNDYFADVNGRISVPRGEIVYVGTLRPRQPNERSFGQVVVDATVSAVIDTVVTEALVGVQGDGDSHALNERMEESLRSSRKQTATPVSSYNMIWVVEDLQDEAIAELRGKHPQLDAPVRKSLIELGESVAVSPAS